MTLTEFKYLIALAREGHFGRAAKACQVSQPTLSIAIRKLEEELGVRVFERRSAAVTVTDIGRLIVDRAQRVLEEVDQLRQTAEQGRDPLRGAFRLGTIPTVAPYLIPRLVPRVRDIAPLMPLVLTENFTSELLRQLRTGQLDAAILALPIELPGLMIQPLYDEPFLAAVPADHPLARRETVSREELRAETMLLLGPGHCFRDQVLDFCSGPGQERRDGRDIEGSSFETIACMVAQGLGVSILPASSAPHYQKNELIRLIRFERPDLPKRRVVLVWRKTFPRLPAIQALKQAVEEIKDLRDCRVLTGLPTVSA